MPTDIHVKKPDRCVHSWIERHFMVESKMKKLTVCRWCDAVRFPKLLTMPKRTDFRIPERA